ncbi:MAG: hypothetical protein KJO35_10730, partial [Gammaproteobacteria bacterium]|nr:hypothetical protein [Gammaproteobacteria bacterium]
FNWMWIVIGLLGGLLAGAFVAVGVFRRNLRQEYEHDVRDAVRRQAGTERLRQQRELDDAAQARSQANETPQVSTPTPTVEIPIAGTAKPARAEDDYTVEMSTVPEVDFDISGAEPAKTGAPETLDIPEAADLDLKLPEAKNQTGQHEVDFDLLEQAYSEHYQTEFVDKDSASDDADNAADDKDEKFYHLENQDESDDTPLPFELDVDLDDDDDDDKVISFRSK